MAISTSERRQTTSVTPTKGLFEDGLWKCNCNPRLPAARLETKTNKNGNEGRWFYKCQRDRHEKACGFFLWEDEAKTRERDALLRNARTEKSGARESTGIPFNEAEDEDEDGALAWSSGSQEDINEPRTPLRPAKTVQLVTPSTTGIKRPREGFLSEESESSKRLRQVQAHQEPPTPSKAAPNTPLACEVFDALRDGAIILPDSLHHQIKNTLNKFARTTEGISKGRELSRAAIKAKDASIAELQCKITRLEAERESDRLVIRNLRDELSPRY